MRKLLPAALAALLTFISACSPQVPATLVLVEGGTFSNSKSPHQAAGTVLADFYIGKYEVTQQEWLAVMGNNPAQVKGENLPVESVSWYDCVEYCNKRSAKEGLTACYILARAEQDPRNTNPLDEAKWTVTLDPEATGYRLPTEAEWEYAAGGGQASRGYTYSGSNTLADVAWYWQNAGDKLLTEPWSWPALVANHNRARPSGSKAPNELGIYDMSGNVREWCWNWHAAQSPDDVPGRIWKGGGWMGADFCCEPSFRASYEASGKAPDQGLRVCRRR